MIKGQCNSSPGDDVASKRKRITRTPFNKRAQSASPIAGSPRNPSQLRMLAKDRRCQSLPPLDKESKTPFDNIEYSQQCVLAPKDTTEQLQNSEFREQVPEKDVPMPHCVITKTMRALATKKREFIKLKKNLIIQQNSLLENYASLKDLETRAGIVDKDLGDIRILSVKDWPAYDLLLLVRDDLEMPMNSEITGIFGPQVLQQLQAQLNPIPEDVLGMGAEIMARRIEILNLLRYKHRSDRATYQTNMEWKAKNIEFDSITEQLHRMVAGIAENLKAKINYSLDLAKIPWIDRETIIKKNERIQKENALLQHKIEEMSKKENEENKEPSNNETSTTSYQEICNELARERAARGSLKEVVSAAENMLRVARGRIVTLEKELKQTKAELEVMQRKHKDMEQLYRHRETSYDVRSRKLIEVSKTGEMAIETLSRQRDLLELRVKELREQAEAAERAAEIRVAEEKAHIDTLQEKVAEQEISRKVAEDTIIELEGRVKELEEQLQSLRERSLRLVDLERKRCLGYVPVKESEPSDKETEIWKELQLSRLALSRTEEELRQSRADKENFLNSLAKIAQEEGDKEDKMAGELLNREQKIMKLQQIIEELRENEKMMEQSMTSYENQMASLRLEVMRLRNYDCYSKEIPYQDLQTELLEMHMQVETLTRERSALVTAAASRALMLERHERAAELFARMTRVRRELAAYLNGQTDPPSNDDSFHVEVSRSLSSVCACSADTWTALRVERARVLRLESAVLAQSLQLEKEGRVRTQLERHKAVLEREILRTRNSLSADKVTHNQKTNFLFY
ncbi:centrosome-associated protein CEP250-like isoform X1 [Vanessa atalanta]|uniref:centrosome-associated protein CEP250-like isoform X1 n=1 Tax=Vanessa atalanta TaxID=42275 RepID=UPI001FCD6326|nr:centrosome-associated protein CEP250-like isoform X1 [Vanessa atalanta]